MTTNRKSAYIAHAASFFISCLAAVFVLGVFTLVAKNSADITIPKQLLGYDAESGTLYFCGEEFILPREKVNSVLSLPEKSVVYTASFLPESIRRAAVILYDTLSESFSGTLGAVLDFINTV